MFATVLMGPRMNTYFVTPSHGFLTYRREKTVK
jgi:hypothetical protein